jgi:hypothetical protein
MSAERLQLVTAPDADAITVALLVLPTLQLADLQG